MKQLLKWKLQFLRPITDRWTRIFFGSWLTAVFTCTAEPIMRMLPPTFKHSVDVLLTLRLTSHLSHNVRLRLFEQKRRTIFISFCVLLEYYSLCVFRALRPRPDWNVENRHGSRIAIKLCLANINNLIKAILWMSAACQRRQWWHYEGWWWSVQSQKECNDTIWHLVHIDSRQIRKRQSLGRTEQTDRAGSWSAFSSIASGVGGDFCHASSSVADSVDPRRQR